MACFHARLAQTSIAKFNWNGGDTETLCKGEIPVLLPDDNSIVFWNLRSVWKYNLSTGRKSKVVDIGYLAKHARASRLSPDGRYVVCRTLDLMQGSHRGKTYQIPSLVVVDLEVRSKRILHQGHDERGPWAWAPHDQHSGSSR